MIIPDNFYTAATLLTLGGSATAVWLITSVIGYLFEIKQSRKLKKWLGIVLSLALALAGATQVQDRALLNWIVAVVNGFLIYLTAVGANTIVSGVAQEESKPPVRETGRKRARGSFIESWW